MGAAAMATPKPAARSENGDDRWLSTEEAAALIDISDTMLRKLCRLDPAPIKHQALGAGKNVRYRFRRAWVEAYIRSTIRGPGQESEDQTD